MKTKKLVQLQALLAAAVELTKLRVEELGLAPNDRAVYDDEEYRVYLKVQFSAYDRIKEEELAIMQSDE